MYLAAVVPEINLIGERKLEDLDHGNIIQSELSFLNMNLEVVCGIDEKTRKKKANLLRDPTGVVASERKRLI